MLFIVIVELGFFNVFIPLQGYDYRTRELLVEVEVSVVKSPM